MKHVILLNPISGLDVKKVSVILPLPVLYVGSAISKDYKVHIIDLRIEENWKKKTEEILKEDVLAVGISCMTGYQIKSALEYAQFVRNINPNIPLIWGGVHPSLDPGSTIKNKLVDYIVIGEGEKTFAELLRALEHKSDLENVDGLCFKKGKKVITTKERALFNLDEYSLPDYSLINVKDYMTTQTLGEKDLAMVTSRGCPARCSYCYILKFNKRIFRSISAEKVVEHIKYVKDHYNVSAIHLTEDNFFPNRERVKKICELLIAQNINVKLRTTCRVDYVYHFTPEMLQLIKKAGFDELYLGVESGSDRVLSYIKKDITKKQVIETCLKLKEAGIVPKFSFMAGFPSETRNEVSETLNLMRTLVELNKDVHCTPIQLYSPYPGTDLFEVSKEYGFKPPEDLEGYADSNWNEIDYVWLSDKDKKFLEKMSFATYFLDGKTIAEYFGNKLPFKLFNKFYGYIVRTRIKHGFYSLMPEVPVIKYIRNKIGKPRGC